MSIKLEWIAPVALTGEHVRLLIDSINAAPEYERQDITGLLKAVNASTAHLFEVPGGLVAVAVREGVDGTRRLHVLAFAGESITQHFTTIAAGLRKLAADWTCDTIETIAYDSRLARAICRVGGEVESYNLMLSVKG